MDNVRGGKRPGAGRKKMRPEDKRINVTLSVAPEIRALMSLMQDEGVNISREFATFIQSYCRRNKLSLKKRAAQEAAAAES